MELSSRENKTVQQVRRLLADAKFRRREQAFVIEGARLCDDAVRSGVPMETALITAEARRRYPETVARVEQAAVHTLAVTAELADYLSQTKTAQGLICVCHPLDNCRSLDKIIDEDVYSTFKDKKWMALEAVRDPGNVGTVIRTAEALGIGGLILSADCCDVYSPKVLRGSMGGVFRLPIYETADLPQTLRRLTQSGLPTWACVPNREAVSVVSAPLGDGSVCVIGNEANGLTAEAVAACGGQLTVPMAGRAESLNAAVAAALVLWEMARRAV